MEYYKIRHKTTGLFSTGGTRPTFKKIGKIWPLRQLKLHLTMIKNGRGSFDIYKDCELVTFTMNPESAKITLQELIGPHEADLIVKKLKGHP